MWLGELAPLDLVTLSVFDPDQLLTLRVVDVVGDRVVATRRVELGV